MQAYAIGMAHGCPDRPLAEVIGAGQLAGTAIYEPGIIGPFRRLFRRTPGYVNSAYWADVAPGDTRDGVRCEDLQQLTFADDSFDLVISSDIFEHVRRPLQGFAEVFRVLRPGGRHVFTVPMRWPLPPVSQPRVDTTTAEDVFVQAARYHSSPTDPRGALVYTDFGMDLPDQLREVGFETATHHGFRNAVTFASRKPGGNGISAAVSRPSR
jgi:SAM-dependent methyltransferase